MIDYEIAVSVPVTKQVGIDSWRDQMITKIFCRGSSLQVVIEWAQSIDKNITLGDLYFSEVIQDD